MDDIVWACAPPVDTSWRDTFKPTPGLKERCAAEVRRVHIIVHASANSLSRCPFCHGWPGSESERET